MGDVINFPFFIEGDCENSVLDRNIFLRMFVFLKELRDSGLRVKKNMGRRWLSSKTEQKLSALVNGSEEPLWREYASFYLSLVEELNERKARGRI